VDPLGLASSSSNTFEFKREFGSYFDPMDGLLGRLSEGYRKSLGMSAPISWKEGFAESVLREFLAKNAESQNDIIDGNNNAQSGYASNLASSDGDGGKGNNPGPFTTDDNQLTAGEANARLTLSDAGYGFAMAWEDFKATKYDANPGKGDWTIGYGHKIKDGENFDGKSLSKTEALALLKGDMVFFEDRVKRNITVALSQQQYDALVIFDMNVSGGLSKNAKLRIAVNNQVDMNTMRSVWYMYSSPNDPTIHQGVLNRRMDEFQIWQNRNYTRDY
jgi:GH24 family phage-related lysozyme (muramidase)